MPGQPVRTSVPWAVAAQKGTEGGELALPADDPRDRRSPAGRAQRRSTTAAIAWPWPMHIEATP